MSFQFNPSRGGDKNEQRDLYLASLPEGHPERLKLEAERMPWKPTAKVNLGSYGQVIHTLKERGYSYAEIAEWLADKTGIEIINRGHVYRAYQGWLAAEHAEFEKDVREGRTELVPTVPTPDLADEEADRRAANADNENTENKSNTVG